MSTGETALDLRALGRDSRRAGWATAAGALIIFGSLVYSAWKLSRLDAKVEQRRAEIIALDDQVHALRSQRDDLLRGIRKQLAGQLPRLPIEAAVVPRASREPTHGGKNGDQFVFAAWLDLPPDRTRDIRAVTYFFNHPTFRNPRLVSRNATNGFRVEYVGWGCLDKVIITLSLRDGSTRALDFNMCDALAKS